MTAPTAAELLHLVDRAERGVALADEYLLLREGIRNLAATNAARKPRQHPGPGNPPAKPADRS